MEKIFNNFNEYFTILRTIVSLWLGSRVCSTAVVRTPRPSLSPPDSRKCRMAHRGNTVTARYCNKTMVLIIRTDTDRKSIVQWRIQLGQPWVWGKKRIFCKIFAENSMKMKEIGMKGGRASLDPLPLDPPMLLDVVRSYMVWDKNTVLEFSKSSFPTYLIPTNLLGSKFSQSSWVGVVLTCCSEAGSHNNHTGL